jgi:hypothetical protein
LNTVVVGHFKNFKLVEQLSLLRELESRLDRALFLNLITNLKAASEDEAMQQFIRGRLEVVVLHE